MDERQSWTFYWDDGRAPQGCCPNGPEALEADLRTFWQAVAQSMGQGDRVLDAACGRGAVYSLLVEARPDLQLAGVDYADTGARSGGLNILGNTDCRSLPFNAGHFHGIVSQFGIEYAGIEGLAECIRVAQPAARFAFVMHHVDSALTKGSMRRAKALADLLASNLFEMARSAARGAMPEGVDDLLFALSDRHASHSVIREIHSALVASLNGGNALIHIDRIESLALAELRRLEAQAASALTSDGIASWCALLRDAGRPVAIDRINLADGLPAAWTLQTTSQAI